MALLAAALSAGPAAATGPERPATAATAAAPPAARPVSAGQNATLAAPAPAIALDFPRGTGAALLRRGDTVLAVFDSPDLRNPEALRRPAVAGLVEAKALAQGFLLKFPIDSAPPLGLTQGPSGWVLGPALGAAARGSGTALAAASGQVPAVAFEGVPPNRVVAVRDPDTGLPLLVGTTREAGRSFAGARRAPEYDLLETDLGVAVLARSESIQLQAIAGRFVVSGSLLSPLSLDSAAVGPTDGGAMTRCLGLPDLPPERLLARLRWLAAELAGTEPLARAALRRDLAATMLALGLAHEAQAEMARAAAEDADAAAARHGQMLAAAAALVAGRVEEATPALRAVAAPGCDEAVLWRALFRARTGDAAAALPGLSATLPLLRSYPPGLRDRLVPLAAEAFVESGAWQPLRGLLANADTKARLPLAAAALLESDGDVDGALAGYDGVARGRDRRARALALRRGAELRLRAGRIDHAAAARAYAPALVAWRGDAAEREARFRLAELLALSGDAGGALALLRQTAALFPDHATAAREAAGRALRSALEGSGPPLSAVAAFQAGSDLLPPGERDAAEARLVELLTALDLPAQAAALLDRAAGRAPPGGAARAEIGWRLAALRLRENDPAGARAALDATDAPDMADGLRERRSALAAAIAERGGSGKPLAEGAGTGMAAEAEAEGALGRRDWAAAARALGRHLDARLPAGPAPLEPAQREAAVRLAAALVLAGDDAALAALRERIAGRMGEGPHATSFAGLVAVPGFLTTAAAGKVAAAGPPSGP